MPTSDEQSGLLADGVSIQVGTIEPTDPDIAEVTGTLGLMQFEFRDSSTGRTTTINLIGGPETFSELTRFVQAANTRVRRLLRDQQ